MSDSLPGPHLPAALDCGVGAPLAGRPGESEAGARQVRGWDHHEVVVGGQKGFAPTQIAIYSLQKHGFAKT